MCRAPAKTQNKHKTVNFIAIPTAFMLITLYKHKQLLFREEKEVHSRESKSGQWTPMWPRDITQITRVNYSLK